MDNDAKNAALRMIPYGLYVLTGESKDGRVAAATVNWVTQASFAPPLVAVGVKVDSGAPIEGRPDDKTLVLKDLGEKTFYGG